MEFQDFSKIFNKNNKFDNLINNCFFIKLILKNILLPLYYEKPFLIIW